MKTRAYKTGFTLIEMIAVIAIIAILISMVVTIAKRIDDQGKERLTRGTLVIIGSALIDTVARAASPDAACRAAAGLIQSASAAIASG